MHEWGSSHHNWTWEKNEHKIGDGHWHHHECRCLANIVIISNIVGIIIIIIVTLIVPLACYHFIIVSAIMIIIFMMDSTNNATYLASHTWCLRVDPQRRETNFHCEVGRIPNPPKFLKLFVVLWDNVKQWEQTQKPRTRTTTTRTTTTTIATAMARTNTQTTTTSTTTTTTTNPNVFSNHCPFIVVNFCLFGIWSKSLI